MKILFVCNQGKHRSKTAAELWKSMHPEVDVEYLGLFNSEFNLSILDWAEKIYVMEENHLSVIKDINIKHWGKAKNIDVPDLFSYNSSSLLSILLNKFSLIN